MTETGFPGSEVASQFADGLARHKAGRLAEAEAIYRRVLARAPDHFDSLHLLGVIFHQRGHHAEAIRQIDLALQRNPRGDFAVNGRGGASVERKRYADAHYNRGNAFYELRRFEEALASYDQALTVRSGYAEALSNRGNTLKELKRLEEALASYDRALAVQPDLTEALLNRGATLDELKRFDEALASYDRALAAEPDLAEALLNRGNTLYELQRFDDALASYDRALTLQPDLVEALSNRGNTLKELKRLDEALASFDRALTVQPDLAAALSNRGNTLKELKRFDEALASYDRALALQPGYAQAHYNRGNVLQELKRFEEALASYDRALELLPDYAEALANRGNTLKELQRFEDALASYDRALTLEPNRPEVHFNRGNILQELERLVEAVACYRRVIQLDPSFAPAHRRLGLSLHFSGDVNAAIASYRDALALTPNEAPIWSELGNSFLALGRVDEAVEAFRHALAINPNLASTLHHLATCHQLTAGNSDMTRLAALADQVDLPIEERAAAKFAIAKSLDDAGLYDEAFAAYDLANRLYRATASAQRDPFDATKLVNQIDRAIADFTPAFFDAVRGWGNPSELPVFIVGMPRSGTTLVEQIVASHSRVFGAGELTIISKAAAELGLIDEGWTQAKIRGTADTYLERLRKLAPAADRVIDKLPDNVFLLGVIATLFPAARIIFCRRDPRDIGLSCFFQKFAAGMLMFSYDLADCGRRIRETERIAAYWHRVLPLRYLDIQYKSLVSDPEGESRRLIEFLDLPWEPACLDFHRTERVVYTASLWQVRQPIYQRSVGRWHHYERHLAPLLRELAVSNARAKIPQ